MAKSTIPPDIKAAALADLMGGEQPAIVAERYGISRHVVKMWKQRHVTEGVTDPPTRVTVHPLVETRKQHIGELVLDLLRTKLEASKAIAQAANDSTWRAKQSGSELAAFGEWLDATAFAIGDRLAGGRAREEQAGDDAAS